MASEAGDTLNGRPRRQGKPLFLVEPIELLAIEPERGPSQGWVRLSGLLEKTFQTSGKPTHPRMVELKTRCAELVASAGGGSVVLASAC